MPMLAEPKRKSKLTLNPRGTLWSNDENKFGQKLLEKMGWSKGKGLGMNEQGMKNPLHVSGNSKSKGIGFKGNPDLTSQHIQNYEKILADLNKIHNPDSSNSEPEKLSDTLKNVESLEMISKNSRKRIHYARFTRAKDMSRWTEDELARVLGSKKSLQGKGNSGMSENQNESIKEEHEEPPKEENSDKKDNFTYGGNLNEYFNQKMEELKRKRREGLLGDEQTPKRIKEDPSSSPGTPFPDLEFEPEKSSFSFNLSAEEYDVKPEEEEKEEKSKKLKHAEAEDNEEFIDKKKKRKSKKTKNIEKVEIDSKSIKDKKEDHYEIFEENENGPEIDVKKAKRKFKNDNDEENNSSEKLSKKKKKKKEKRVKEDQCLLNFKSEEPLTQDSSELNIEYELQPTSNMNESYVKATSTAEKKKKKRMESPEETTEDKEDGSGSRHLKKLRKLASEISLPEAFKSSSEKIENENNANCEVENGADVKTIEEGKEKSNIKVKLKSKRSFKELKTDFETKVKEKFKKISKTELIPIKEESNPESTETKELERNTSKSVNLKVPLGYDNGDYINSSPKQYKTVQFDVQKTFPNSNLEQIKGYFKS